MEILIIIILLVILFIYVNYKVIFVSKYKLISSKLPKYLTELKYCIYLIGIVQLMEKITKG